MTSWHGRSISGAGGGQQVLGAIVQKPTKKACFLAQPWVALKVWGLHVGHFVMLWCVLQLWRTLMLVLLCEMIWKMTLFLALARDWRKTMTMVTTTCIVSTVGGDVTLNDHSLLRCDAAFVLSRFRLGKKRGGGL